MDGPAVQYIEFITYITFTDYFLSCLEHLDAYIVIDDSQDPFVVFVFRIKILEQGNMGKAWQNFLKISFLHLLPPHKDSFRMAWNLIVTVGTKQRLVAFKKLDLLQVADDRVHVWIFLGLTQSLLTSLMEISGIQKKANEDSFLGMEFRFVGLVFGKSFSDEGSVDVVDDDSAVGVVAYEA